MGVDEETHDGSAGEKHRMVSLGGGVIEAGLDIGGLKIGEVFEDLLLRDTGGEEVEHVLDTNAHAADAGPASALGRIEGDSIVHGQRIVDACGGVKRRFEAFGTAETLNRMRLRSGPVFLNRRKQRERRGCAPGTMTVHWRAELGLGVPGGLRARWIGEESKNRSHTHWILRFSFAGSPKDRNSDSLTPHAVGDKWADRAGSALPKHRFTETPKHRPGGWFGEVKERRKTARRKTQEKRKSGEPQRREGRRGTEREGRVFQPRIRLCALRYAATGGREWRRIFRMLGGLY